MMETLKANHRVYFPNHTAEIRHILRIALSSRKQVPGGMMGSKAPRATSEDA